MSYGQRLREERKRLRKTQQQIAELTGLPAHRISLLEGGGRSLRAQHLAKLHGAGYDITYVLTGSRREGAHLPREASEFLTVLLGLPEPMRASLAPLLHGLPAQMAEALAPGSATEA